MTPLYCAIILARQGYNVTGLDLSEKFLQNARQKAESLRVNLDLEKRDMRDIQHLNEFDAVINVFTAFGFFDSGSDDLLVLQGVARALKPGGQFLIDTINREYAIQSQQSQSWNISAMIRHVWLVSAMAGSTFKKTWAVSLKFTTNTIWTGYPER